MVECYLIRWKCYECYRYIKQSYNIEEVGVRSYNGLRNIIVMVHVFAYFTGNFMDTNIKLNIMIGKVYIMSLRFFELPNFFNYTMADGIYNLLKLIKTGLVNFVKVKSQPIFNLTYS